MKWEPLGCPSLYWCIYIYIYIYIYCDSTKQYVCGWRTHTHTHTHIYIYIYILKIGMIFKEFANGPGDLGSIVGQVLPKIKNALLNSQHYKLRIKGKVEWSRERSSALVTPWCSSNQKWSFPITLYYDRLYIYIYIFAVLSIYFQTFSVWALLLIVHAWNSSPLWSNLLQLQCTCCTVPTTSGTLNGSPLVWACQWPSSQPLSSPQLSHNDSL